MIRDLINNNFIQYKILGNVTIPLKMKIKFNAVQSVTLCKIYSNNKSNKNELREVILEAHIQT